jgi:hypothetical protein
MRLLVGQGSVDGVSAPDARLTLDLVVPNLLTNAFVSVMRQYWNVRHMSGDEHKEEHADECADRVRDQGRHPEGPSQGMTSAGVAERQILHGIEYRAESVALSLVSASPPVHARLDAP